MNKQHKDAVVTETPDTTGGAGYRHYLGMVKVLERLKRQSDLEFGPRLMNKILDARHGGLISDEQAVELTDRIHAWSQKLEEHFVSQEYQMKKLMLAIEMDERRSGKKPSTL
jgi:hypothetical protein